MKRIVLMSIMMAGLLCAGPLAAVENNGTKIAVKDPKIENKESQIDTRAPKIEIKEMRYDFGRVVKGTQVSHVFEIKNVGNEELIIQKVQSS